MMENELEDYGPWSLVNTSEESREISNECLNTFTEELPQVEGYHTLFTAIEDELVEVERFLAEPKYNELVDGILSFDSFSLQKCFNIEGLSAAEYSYVKTNGVALASNLIPGESVKNGVLDRKLEGTTDGLSEGIDSHPDICEDYLLDTEFDGIVSDVDCVPRNMENIYLNHRSTGSSEINCGAENVELPTADIPTEEAIFDQKSSLLDKMTIEELHGTFRNMSGQDTAVKDPQWLKRRISFGLQNHDVLGNCLESTENFPTSKSKDSEREMGSMKESDPLTGVFKFRTKPRVRNVKRGKQVCYDYLKRFSFEVNKLAVGLTDLREEKSAMVRKKRSCKPTQRYIDESLVHNLKNQRRNYGSRDRFSEGRLVGSNVESDMGRYSADSQGEISEDDCITRTMKQNGKGRKQHTVWSLPEVLKLVEGVSKFGVGKWTEIKRLLFPLSAHRTAVDLKDKWRNLLRASSKGSHGKGRCNLTLKHAPKTVPQHILCRVRELSIIHPYPRSRQRNIEISQSPSSIPTLSFDNLLPLSTAVEV